MRALLVRLSAIGDVVHTLPVLAALRRHGWEASWLVEPLARPLLEGNPALARVVAAPSARAFSLRQARATLAALRSTPCDVALDLQGLWKSAAWAWLSRAQRVVGQDRRSRREPSSALLLDQRVPASADAVHVIDKNLALLRALGIEAVGLREFPLPPSPQAAAAVEAAVRENALHDFAILNAGGGWSSKLWPPEGYGAVSRGLRQRGLRAVVTWGPGEEALADAVVAASDGAAWRCLPTTLLEYVELARRARVVVAADTGPMQLACAVETPVVALFGPTDPVRNGPFSAADVVVRRVPACAPCHRRRCPTHEGVMNAIEPAEVLAAIDRRLEAIRPVRGVAASQ